MDIKEKIKYEINSFFTSDPYMSNNEGLQSWIDQGVAKMAIMHDWTFAPSIPYISTLVTVYGEDPRDIVIYGAGTVGEDALFDLKVCNLEPQCFCDSDTKKWGTFYCGYCVISPEELVLQHKSDYIIISSIRNMYDIFNYLVKIGIPKEHIYIPPFEPIYNIVNLSENLTK